MYVCLYGYVPHWNLIFKNLYVIGWCPANMNIPAPKIGAFEVDSKTQHGHFLENICKDSDYISAIYGDHLHK
jgi:hypothetical protein